MIKNAYSFDENPLISFKLLEGGQEANLVSNYNKKITDQIEKNIENENEFEEETPEENRLFFNIIFLKDYFMDFFMHHIKKSKRYLELTEEEEEYDCFFKAIDDNVMLVFYESIFSKIYVRPITKEKAKEEFEKLLMKNMDFDKIPVVISRINNSLLDLRAKILDLYLINIYPQIMIEISEQVIEGATSGIIGSKDDEMILSGIKRISHMGFSMLLVLNAFMNVARKKNGLSPNQKIKNSKKEKSIHFNRRNLRVRNGCRLL